jgi:NAD(P)H dehydrogenase (quinone)
MAQSVAEGVREAGAEAVVKRVPEVVPEEIARKSGYKLDQAAPIATVNELPTMTRSSSGLTRGTAT